VNHLSTSSNLALGIDIGGSKTAIGVVDLHDGTVLRQQVVATPPRHETGVPFLVDLCQRAVAMRNGDQPNVRIEKVGIGVCEIVDRSGEIGSAHRVEISRRQVRDAFSEFREIAIGSDVRAAAIAEARFGLGRGRVHWVYVNAGTGVSSVLMNGEECYMGTHGWIASLGMSPANLYATNTEEGMLIEEIGGGSGLVLLARQKGLQVSALHELFSAAASKSQDAIQVLETGGHVMGGAIALLVNILDPEVVVVGGGVVSLDSPYWQGLRTAVEKHTWHPPAKQIPVLRSALSTKAGLIGAAFASGSHQIA